MNHDLLRDFLAFVRSCETNAGSVDNLCDISHTSSRAFARTLGIAWSWVCDQRRAATAAGEPDPYEISRHVRCPEISDESRDTHISRLSDSAQAKGVSEFVRDESVVAMFNFAKDAARCPLHRIIDAARAMMPAISPLVRATLEQEFGFKF